MVVARPWAGQKAGWSAQLGMASWHPGSGLPPQVEEETAQKTLAMFTGCRSPKPVKDMGQVVGCSYSLPRWGWQLSSLQHMTQGDWKELSLEQSLAKSNGRDERRVACSAHPEQRDFHADWFCWVCWKVCNISSQSANSYFWLPFCKYHFRNKELFCSFRIALITLLSTMLNNQTPQE